MLPEGVLQLVHPLHPLFPDPAYKSLRLYTHKRNLFPGSHFPDIGRVLTLLPVFILKPKRFQPPAGIHMGNHLNWYPSLHRIFPPFRTFV